MKHYYEFMQIESLPGEEWRPIKNYPLYQVSNLGRVKSITYERYVAKLGRVFYYHERILKQATDSKGYLRVGIYKDGKRHTLRVNRLVAIAFIPNPHNLPEVNHLSEDKKDNTVANLMWVTHKINSNWGTRTARGAKARTGQKRSEETKEKLSKRFGKPVECDGMTFNSCNRCAQHYGVVMQTMARWLNGTCTMPQEWAKRGLKYI